MALTQVNGGMLDSVAQQVGFRNRIINGAMMIDQRNAGASVTVGNGTTNGNYYGYCLDRWWYQNYTSGSGGAGFAFTIQQSTVAPSGFKNSAVITVTTSKSSLGSNDAARFRQGIEGYNVADFNFGSSNAKAMTVSFWVRSSLTGTFGAAVYNGNIDRSYPFSYTITSANAWEQKTITVAGDTTGTWATDNSAGLYVDFSLGAGSAFSGTANTWQSGFYIAPTGATSVVGTNGATFYITGVQLEKGSTATSFDYRPYGTELALCQRYYEQSDGSHGSMAFWSGNSLTGYAYYVAKGFCVQKRASPTMVGVSSDAAGFPSTMTINTSQDKMGFRTSRIADSSFNGGYYITAWSASAEL